MQHKESFLWSKLQWHKKFWKIDLIVWKMLINKCLLLFVVIVVSNAFSVIITVLISFFQTMCGGIFYGKIWQSPLIKIIKNQECFVCENIANILKRYTLKNIQEPGEITKMFYVCKHSKEITYEREIQLVELNWKKEMQQILFDLESFGRVKILMFNRSAFLFNCLKAIFLRNMFNT